MKNKIRLSVKVLASAVALTASLGVAQATEISIFCSSAGVEPDLCESAANAWAEETGHTVRINRMPASWGEALPLFQQLLAGRSSDIDLMTLDNIGVGALAPISPRSPEEIATGNLHYLNSIRPRGIRAEDVAR